MGAAETMRRIAKKRREPDPVGELRKELERVWRMYLEIADKHDPDIFQDTQESLELFIRENARLRTVIEEKDAEIARLTAPREAVA